MPLFIILLNGYANYILKKKPILTTEIRDKNFTGFWGFLIQNRYIVLRQLNYYTNCNGSTMIKKSLISNQKGETLPVYTINPFYRILSYVLLYTITLEILIPSARAMNAIARMYPPDQTFTMPLVDQEIFSSAIPPMADPLPAHSVARLSVAASGGKGQTESSGLSLNTMDGMVDKFTGDFSYNIPLMDVEGYPITISYNSNVGMHDEASWVGLGWNLNVGSVSREMRGIPDDFNGTQNIKRTFNLKEDNTADGKKLGAIGGAYANLFKGWVVPGTDLTLLWGSYQNSYVGKGKTFDFGFSSRLSVGKPLYFGPKFGLGYNSDTKNGVGKSSSVGLMAGFQTNMGTNAEVGLAWGSNFNSRAGLTERSRNLTFSGGVLGSAMHFGIFGSTFATSSLTSVPRLEMSRTSTSRNLIGDITVSYNTGLLRYKLGMESQFYSDNQQFQYSDQTSQVIYNPAYGYFHVEKRDNYTEGYQPVMDFNRERDQEFSAESKNLTFAFPTCDIFHVNADGISASFRAHRDDVGTYHDGTNTLISTGTSDNGTAGIVFGAGIGIEAGYNRGNQDGSVESGRWNTAMGALNFNRAADNYFFKGIGEPTPRKTALLEAVQFDKPIAVRLQKSSDGKSIERSSEFMYPGGVNVFTSQALNNENNAGGREVIANIYTPIIAGKATELRPIQTFPAGEFANPMPTPTTIGRTSGIREFSHLSAVEVMTAEGMRYEYGIPAYAIKQSEVVFSTNKTAEDFAGIVSYSALEASISNTAGRANLYDKTEVPAFADAFLLTGMFSSDYVDRGEPGPSLEDHGSWYKFNYSRIYGESNPYRWRFPISGNSASAPKALFNKGLLGSELDNTASYTYSEKEIWYTHSIESPNFVAEFELDDRLDAYSVNDENGTINESKPLKLLKKIKLYNRNERQTNPDAKPMQTVEFIYDYSLCLKNPANKNTYNGQTAQSGKLTLKEIRTYSGPVSEETALAPYEFTYSTGTQNPDFSYVNTDRWGKYKPDNATRPNNLFPYAEQDAIKANQSAQAWKLTKIVSPMGAEMSIDYESDTYTYVQDRRAAEHVDIHGYMTALELVSLSYLTTWNGSSPYITSTLNKNFNFNQVKMMVDAAVPGWSSSSAAVNTAQKAINKAATSTSNDLKTLQELKSVPSNVVIVKLKERIPVTNTKAQASLIFKDRYLKDVKASPIQNGYLKELYLRNFVKLKFIESTHEMVPTFADIDQGTIDFTSAFPFVSMPTVGVLPPDPDGYFEYGYIVLNTVDSDESKDAIPMHPVQKTAMEFARLHLPDKVYGSCEDCDPDLSIDKKVFWKGNIYKQMDAYGYCKSVDLARSTVRLLDHDSTRYGGNARVKRITYSDKWDAISGEYGATYFWDYTYKNGVAAYEPKIGNDENAFYRWNTYKNKSTSFPDESRFTEDPAMASLFPAAVVGYQEVTVSLGGNAVVASNYLGKSITEYYTAADRPVYTRSTEMQKISIQDNKLVGKDLNVYGFSQGHVIVTNDFHGKIKGHKVYSANNDLQESSLYQYRDGLQKVNTLDRQGNLAQERVALEYDICADTRFILSESSTKSVGVTGIFPLPFFFPPILFPVLQKSSRESGFYTNVVNKHINYSAILEKVTTNTLGSENSAQSLVYDRYSGNAILSSMKNEYNDVLYSLQYPAHWYYQNFQSPLMHSFLPLTGTMSSGDFQYSSPLSETLLPGDYVYIERSGTGVNAYVLSVTGNSAKLINDFGSPITGVSGSNSKLTLIKSGRKNRLYETMQALTTLKNPVNGSIFTFPVSTAPAVGSDVMNINALTYQERNNMFCYQRVDGKVEVPNQVVYDIPMNPFRYGLKNNLVMESAYSLQTELDRTQLQRTRYNGTLTNYKPFYALNATDHKWYKINESGHPGYLASKPLQNWRAQDKAVTFDEYGNALESKDANNIYSSVIYGYSRLLKLAPIAQAVNARQHEIAYDGFEDYNYFMPNANFADFGHFDFSTTRGTDISLTTVEKHSGLRSLKLDAGAQAVSRKNVTRDCTVPANGLKDGLFVSDSCLCVKPFAPTTGDYIIGAWLKGGDMSAAAVYSAPRITVSVYASGTLVGTNVFAPSGKILDGWQRLEGEFSIPANATSIIITLQNTAENESVYFDDVRIHPFTAGMSTVVYDPKTMLPLATHDAYNYTTFYNYDENLSPVRVRVETTEGIQTVSESESSILKIFK